MSVIRHLTNEQVAEKRWVILLSSDMMASNGATIVPGINKVSPDRNLDALYKIYPMEDAASNLCGCRYICKLYPTGALIKYSKGAYYTHEIHPAPLKTVDLYKPSTWFAHNFEYNFNIEYIDWKLVLDTAVEDGCVDDIKYAIENGILIVQDIESAFEKAVYEKMDVDLVSAVIKGMMQTAVAYKMKNDTKFATFLAKHKDINKVVSEYAGTKISMMTKIKSIFKKG